MIGIDHKPVYMVFQHIVMQAFQSGLIQNSLLKRHLKDNLYSRFMEGLKAANVDLDRKVLADLAVSDEKAFDAIFAQAKKAIEAKDGAALRA